MIDLTWQTKETEKKKRHRDIHMQRTNNSNTVTRRKTDKWKERKKVVITGEGERDAILKITQWKRKWDKDGQVIPYF